MSFTYFSFVDFVSSFRVSSSQLRVFNNNRTQKAYGYCCTRSNYDNHRHKIHYKKQNNDVNSPKCSRVVIQLIKSIRTNLAGNDAIITVDCKRVSTTEQHRGSKNYWNDPRDCNDFLCTRFTVDFHGRQWMDNGVIPKK